MPAVEQMADFHLLQQGYQPADVVVVRMRGHDDIDPPDAHVAQERQQHLFAVVEVFAALTAINDHGFAVGEAHKSRVALAHVQKDDLQVAGAERVGPHCDIEPDERRENGGLARPRPMEQKRAE